MPDPTREKARPADPAAEPARGRLSAAMERIPLLPRLRAWTSVHWTRGAAVAGTAALLVAATIGAWAYLANLALQSARVRLETTLAALDQGDYEQSRSLAGTMLSDGFLPRSEYGGPLFVLGAVKVHDAEQQATPDRRRSDYLIASRYLKEARAFGLPAGRDVEGRFLLAKSLVESNQFPEGIAIAEELLTEAEVVESPLATPIRRLVAQTSLWMPFPDLGKALANVDALLTDQSLSADERNDALLLRAETLSRLGRFEEARDTLAGIAPAAESGALLLMSQGQLALDELERALQKAATHQHAQILVESEAAIEAAMQKLQEARGLNEQSGAVTRRCEYLLGRGFELRGQTDAALQQFVRCRQLYHETLEGTAAALAEGDLLRRKGDVPAALLAYRRVLESISNPESYRSVVMPLDTVRRRLLEALAEFVDQERFDEGLTLLAHFPPLFSRTEQLEFRGATLQRWGDLQLTRAAGETGPQGNKLRTAGLRHLREAGVAYQLLAELRFATSFYTNDLWTSAENFYRGSSFTRTVIVLNEYLKHEPELRTAQALLRLGQAHLALGQVPQSIAAFEECIEFFPLDSSTYQARIDCAKAYWHLGDTAQSERLLRDNIAGSTLKPSSREWKDSLFELGMLLHEVGKHEEAIGTLEEAIERYPQDPQNLLAQFVIGESYRRSAESLLEQVRQSRTTSERDKSLQAATARLNSALESFNTVQRTITLKTHDIHGDPQMGTMLRNCYLLEGTVLFDLERYEDAIKAFSNVSSLYPDEPFVLETFVQIANCWRRLERADKARGAIQQAQIALEKFPGNADFAATTAFSRDEWRLLLNDMSRW